MSIKTFIEQVQLNYKGLIVPTKVPGSYWGRATKILKECGITKDDALLLGKWLSRQAWLSNGITVIVAAQKAGEWLAKAQAEKTTASKESKVEWANLDIEGLEVE